MQTMNANSQNEIPVWFMDGSQTLLSNSLPSRMNEWKKFDVWSLACCLLPDGLPAGWWGLRCGGDHESQSATRLIVWGWPGPTPEMRREEERCPGPGPGPGPVLSSVLTRGGRGYGSVWPGTGGWVLSSHILTHSSQSVPASPVTHQHLAPCLPSVQQIQDRPAVRKTVRPRREL